MRCGLYRRSVTLARWLRLWAAQVAHVAEPFVRLDALRAWLRRDWR